MYAVVTGTGSFSCYHQMTNMFISGNFSSHLSPKTFDQIRDFRGILHHNIINESLDDEANALSKYFSFHKGFLDYSFLTKARGFDIFFDLRLNKRLNKAIETLVIWDAIALSMTSL